MRFVNNLKTTLLLGSLIGLCMLIGHLWLGPNGVVFGLLFGGVGNLIAYFFSDKIVLASMGGREVTRDQIPWLFDMVERLALRAGLPMPKIYVCPQAAPNAFATGRSPSHAAVAITEGMLRSFPAHEIEGVMAHELAHVRHRDMLTATIASVLAGLISYAAYAVMWFGGGGDRRSESPLGAIGALLMLILAPLAAGLIQMAISRQREYAADSYGAELCGDPLKLAAALVRLGGMNERIPTDTPPAFHSLYIVQPLTGGGLMEWFSTHPSLEKRITLLQQMAR
jgi:heat shock protein HtpX